LHWVSTGGEKLHCQTTALKCGFYLNIVVETGGGNMLLAQKIPGIEQKVSVTFAETLPIYDFADD
jgi:hypothetical protein